VRGDVIVGNLTPKWARLPKGTVDQELVMLDANDPGWRTPKLTGIISGFQCSDGDLVDDTDFLMIGSNPGIACVGNETMGNNAAGLVAPYTATISKLCCRAQTVSGAGVPYIFTVKEDTVGTALTVSLDNVLFACSTTASDIVDAGDRLTMSFAATAGAADAGTVMCSFAAREN